MNVTGLGNEIYNLSFLSSLRNNNENTYYLSNSIRFSVHSIPSLQPSKKMKHGEKYWSIDMMGNVFWTHWSIFSIQDQKRKQFGNFFKTEKKAIEASDRIKRMFND